MLSGHTLDFYSGTTGEGLLKHTHDYSHLTYCSSGSILVKMENNELLMTKDTPPRELPANQWHQVEILEPNTAFVNVFENDVVTQVATGAKLINGNLIRLH